MKNNLLKILLMLFMIFSVVGCPVSEKEENKVLVDKNGSIPAGGIMRTEFTINKATAIKVDVNVSEGNGVKIFLIDNENYTKLENNQSFSYFVTLSSVEPVISYTKTATLPAGTWNIAVVNTNLLKSQVVSRKITVQ